MAAPVNRRQHNDPPPTVPLARAGDVPVSDANQAHILVVDDLPEKLLVFESVLEELGQNVVTVASGEEALRSVLAREFAVILLDVNMPGLDGFETAALIRRRKNSAHTPIIFITAYADEMHTAQGYALGAVDYILSPVVPEVLRAKVKVFVELYRMRQSVKRHAEERIALVREQMARSAAEEATRRSTFLAEASRTLASSLDLSTTFHGLAHLVVPFLADVSMLVVSDENTPTLPPVQLAYENDSNVETALMCAVPQTALAKGLERVFASGKQELLKQEERGEWGLGCHLNAVAILPLTARGRTLGAWALALGPSAREFSASDLALAGDLADRAAIAIDNALLLAREQAARAELSEKAKELLKLNSDLKNINIELDAFAYVASHDLKEPLRGIHNFAHFLLEDYADKLDPEGVAKLKTLTHLTQRMQKLLDSLLHYSRVGRQDLTMSEVNLQHMVEGATELLQARIQETGTQLRIPRQLPTAVVDHRSVGEVFMNLISNAIKYNDKPKKWVEVGYTNGRETPVFYVKDNGIGIPKQHHDAIFRIFRRLHGRDEYGGGVGAGLTIVKKIVERHGGKIWLDSTPGEGCTFYFTLAHDGPTAKKASDAVTR